MRGAPGPGAPGFAEPQPTDVTHATMQGALMIERQAATELLRSTSATERPRWAAS